MEWWWWCWGVRTANTEHKCAKSYSIPLRCICGSFACRFFHFAIIYLFFRINNPLGFALTLWYTFLFYFALAGGASASVAAAANLLTPWTHREYKTKESIFINMLDTAQCASNDDNVCQLTFYSYFTIRIIIGVAILLFFISRSTCRMLKPFSRNLCKFLSLSRFFANIRQNSGFWSEAYNFHQIDFVCAFFSSCSKAEETNKE